MSLIRKVDIRDSDGNDITESNPLNVTDSNLNSETEGTIKKVLVEDLNSEELLNEILKQLKVISMHLSLITDTNITKREV